jgi:hypothetical protein
VLDYATASARGVLNDKTASVAAATFGSTER